MSTTGHPEPDEHRHVRRLLKDLPKVEVSPDFEIRLQRTINAQKPAAAAPRRFAIPAFAYSFLTLLVVTIVSYYMFFRQAETPAVPPQQPPADRSAPAAPPASAPDVRQPAAGSQDAAPAFVPPVRSEEKKKEQSSSPAPASPGPAAGDDRALQKARPPAERQLESAQPQIVEPAKPAGEADGLGLPPAAAPRNALKEEQKANPQIQPEESPVRTIIPSLPPLLKSAAAPSQAPTMYVAPESFDSAARQDSVARDSLRQKDRRRLQERLQKRKRPIE